MYNVIFDFDGTLVDSARLTYMALELAAPQLGLERLTQERIRRSIGYARGEFYHHLYPDCGEDQAAELEQLVERLEIELLEGIDSLLFPGCLDMLNELKRSGAELYIASTGEKEHVMALAGKEGILHLFSEIRYGKADKTRMVSELMLRAKGEWIMVGDMHKDYEAAHENEIKCVGACYGYCIPAPDTFDCYAYSPAELLQMLKF